MFVIPLKEYVGPRGLMNRSMLSYYTAVIAVLIAGDVSEEACQISAYVL